MKRLTASLALIAVALTARAAPPPVIYSIESDYQQAQALPRQTWQQGANGIMQFRLTSRGKYLSLAGLTGRWDARSSATSTSAYSQVSSTTYTSAAPNYIQVAIDGTKTGTPVTNWVWSLTVLSGLDQYIIGTGRVDIAASAYTGAAGQMTNITSSTYTDAATNALGVALRAQIVAATGALDTALSAEIDGDVTAATNALNTAVRAYANAQDVLATNALSGALTAALTSAYAAADTAATGALGTAVSAEIVAATNALNSVAFTGEVDPLAVLADGTRSMSGNLNMASNSLHNILYANFAEPLNGAFYLMSAGPDCTNAPFRVDVTGGGYPLQTRYLTTTANITAATNALSGALTTAYGAADTAATGALGTAVSAEIVAATNACVQVSGDTMTGALLTTRDFTTTAPASDEFPSASWVRSLAMQGAEWFFTATVTNGFGEKTANFVALSESAQSQFTNSIASPVASATYLAGGVATQMFGAVRSPITFEIYMNRVGGNTSTVIPVHPEIYYIYSGTTNHLGDWDSANQVITATTPTKYTFTVAFVEPSITGSVYVIGYLKSGTVSGTAAGLNIYGGGIYPSHMNIEGVNAGETAADVAADLATHAADADAHGVWVAQSNGTATNLTATNLTARGVSLDGTVLDGGSGSALTNFTYASVGVLTVSPGPLQMSGSSLLNPGDPVTDAGVGDRGYNDLRYAALAHNQTLATVTNAGALAAEDWPASDGSEYVAKNGAWAVATGGGAWTDDGDGTTSYTATNLAGPSVLITAPTNMTADAKVFDINRNGSVFSVDEDGDVLGKVFGDASDNGVTRWQMGASEILGYLGNVLVLDFAANALRFGKNGVDVNTQVRTSGDDYAIWVDGGTDFVGIGTATPAAKLHVGGTNAAIAVSAHYATPAANTNYAQFFATNAASAEMWVMDGMGNSYCLTDGSGGTWTDDGDGTASYTATSTNSTSVQITAPATMVANTKLFDIDRGGSKFSVDAEGDVVVGGNMIIPTGGIIGSQDFAQLEISSATGALIINEKGRNVDTRIEGASDTSLFVVDAGLNRVGIGTATPAAKLHVDGAIALNDMTTPAANTNYAQFFATNAASAEMWVMDGAGNVTQLSSHNKDLDHIAKSYNVYTGVGREINMDALAIAIEAIAKMNPQVAAAVVDAGYTADEIYKPIEVSPVDWDKEQAVFVAAADAKIAAWLSDTNAVEVKGEKPPKVIKQPKPAWLVEALNEVTQ